MRRCETGRGLLTSQRPFRIVTRKRWLFEQFEPLGAVQDWGWDIDPVTAGDTIWWAPGAWVASARNSGVTLPLLSCGPYWLDRLPESYRGRWVFTMPMSVARNWRADAPRVFVKLPEAKADFFEASLHGHNEFWSATLDQYRVPPETLVQLQQPVNFVAEARFFIAFGRVVASSLYRLGDWLWCDDGLAPNFGGLRDLELFADRVAGSVAAPPGYVLDVGLTDDDRILVVEANAAWSSGPYDADPFGVFEAISAAHDFAGVMKSWAWEPNPLFASVGGLRVRQSPCSSVGLDAAAS